MKKISLFLVLFGAAITGFAQQKTNKAEVTQGPEVITTNSQISYVVGYDADGYYIMRFSKKKRLLEHINKNMVIDRSVELPDKYEYKKQKRIFSRVLLLGGEMYLLTTVTDKITNTFTLFAQTVDKNLLLPSTELKTIYSCSFPASEGVKLGSPLRSAVYNSITSTSYSISDNKSYILFYLNLDAFGEGNYERKHLYVLDNKLNAIWDNVIEIPYNADLFEVNGLTVDNEGNAYITGIEYQERAESRNSRRENVPSYKYHLLSYKEKSKNKFDYTIELNNNFIKDVRTGIAPNGDLVAVGFYSEKGSYSVKGAFYMTIDGGTCRVKKQKTTAFEPEFIRQNMSDREKQKSEKDEAKGKPVELYSFDLQNLIIQDDGGATFIAEQFYTYTTSSRDANGATTTITNYHYNDIIALSFNSDGSLGWKTKIPKRENSTNDNGAYASYAYAKVGGKIYLIFNDNKKNLSLKDGEEPFYSDDVVSLVTIDASNGMFTRELLFPLGPGCYVPPKKFLQTGDNEMFIYEIRYEGILRRIFTFRKVVFNP